MQSGSLNVQAFPKLAEFVHTLHIPSYLRHRIDSLSRSLARWKYSGTLLRFLPHWNQADIPPKSGALYCSQVGTLPKPDHHLMVQVFSARPAASP